MKIKLLICSALALTACADRASSPDRITQPELAVTHTGASAAHGQLAAARSVTARYQQLDAALADGYADINVFYPGMGYHYLKASILDAEFNPSEPELLVYYPDPSGRMKLVAVEYAVPLSLLPSAPPEGFGGSDDVWSRNETFQLWTLHAWVWLDNPGGIFQPYNSRLQ